MQKRVKEFMIAVGFSLYSLVFLTGNTFGEEKEVQTKREYPSSENLATDYRPLFDVKLFSCLYSPRTEEQRLERTLIEENAKEKMGFKSVFENQTVITYPILEIRFKIPFID